MRIHPAIFAVVGLALLAAPAVAQTQLGLPNVPSSFTALPYNDDFEGHAGVVPAHMAINKLNSATLVQDPLAWCNIGQDAACINPNSGAFNLEMGNVPNTSNFVDVLNALVIGLDGSGYSGSTGMEFFAIDGGEEDDPEDGVWLSDNGLDYFRIYGPWTPIPDNTWTLQAANLAGSGVNIGGQFLMAFVQNDNFPYLDLDGIGIDDINLPPRARLSTGTLTGGLYGIFQTDNAQPKANVVFLASLQGRGTDTFMGVQVDILNPISFATAKSDNGGTAVAALILPRKASGRNVSLQSVVFGSSGSETSNVVDAVIN